jgi:hypothetical protein
VLVLPSDDIGVAGGIVLGDLAPKCFAMDAAHMVRYQYGLKRILMIDDACIMCITTTYTPRSTGRYKSISANRPAGAETYYYISTPVRLDECSTRLGSRSNSTLLVLHSQCYHGQAGHRNKSNDGFLSTLKAALPWLVLTQEWDRVPPAASAPVEKAPTSFGLTMFDGTLPQ